MPTMDDDTAYDEENYYTVQVAPDGAEYATPDLDGFGIGWDFPHGEKIVEQYYVATRHCCLCGVEFLLWRRKRRWGCHVRKYCSKGCRQRAMDRRPRHASISREERREVVSALLRADRSDMARAAQELARLDERFAGCRP